MIYNDIYIIYKKLLYIYICMRFRFPGFYRVPKTGIGSGVPNFWFFCFWNRNRLPVSWFLVSRVPNFPIPVSVSPFFFYIPKLYKQKLHIICLKLNNFLYIIPLNLNRFFKINLYIYCLNFLFGGIFVS